MDLKIQAAKIAVTFVRSGMVVGLGSGSTAAFAIEELSKRLAGGELEGIKAVPCSLQAQKTAEKYDVPLTTLEKYRVLDLTIDGADEVDPDLNLIKGGGGALLREKIVAQASKREIIIIDQSKLSPVLGTNWPVPIEVLAFGWHVQAEYIQRIGGRWQLRKFGEDKIYLTDNGNYILDCDFGPINDLTLLSAKLASRAGIIEHGLFIDIATDLIVCGENSCRHLTKPD